MYMTVPEYFVQNRLMWKSWNENNEIVYVYIENIERNIKQRNVSYFVKIIPIRWKMEIFNFNEIIF